jgi:hypothetical protein
VDYLYPVSDADKSAMLAVLVPVSGVHKSAEYRWRYLAEADVCGKGGVAGNGERR